ncbi:hypothetical protein [Hydrogenophaga sp. IBVHS2]|uniref:hypothetical protein n=1 Tax=Hydrogenophaga sp. IBVHS2 TaxID=1985170 RepID=UPI00117AD509|nr:hypothetical protein [Hydrogenophaga sp. IBVHS2]
MRGFWIGIISTCIALLLLPVVAHPGAEPIRDWLRSQVQSNAPAWVQAIGSVAAVAIVIWIDRRATAQAERAASQYAVLFMAQALESIDQAAETSSNAIKAQLRSNLAALDDCYEVGKSVRLEFLPPRKAVSVSMVRSHIVQARSATQHALDSSSGQLVGLSLANVLAQYRDAVLAQQANFSR